VNPEQELLAGLALASFKLNGRFLALADELARPVGLTATWWQVLGAVLRDPLSVSEIAREMGLTRQSVQRTADLLVDRGLADYRDNPAHKRAKLVALTETGRQAVARINPAHLVAAEGLVDLVGADKLADLLDGLGDLTVAVEKITR
jgi:DNA-binding MarR family transcriptional regulator